MTGITPRDFRYHLNWAQGAGRDGWSVIDDYALVEAIVQRRDGFGGAARVLGRSAEDCRVRWQTLYPAEVRSIELQAVLMHHLRASAGLPPRASGGLP